MIELGNKAIDFMWLSSCLSNKVILMTSARFFGVKSVKALSTYMKIPLPSSKGQEMSPTECNYKCWVCWVASWDNLVDRVHNLSNGAITMKYLVKWQRLPQNSRDTGSVKVHCGIRKIASKRASITSKSNGGECQGPLGLANVIFYT